MVIVQGWEISPNFDPQFLVAPKRSDGGSTFNRIWSLRKAGRAGNEQVNLPKHQQYMPRK
jgi:hypothetical protein